MSFERLLMPIGCIPLGHPGPSLRKPIAQTAYLDRWGSAVSW